MFRPPSRLFPALAAATLLAACAAAPPPAEHVAAGEAAVRSAQWRLAQGHEQRFDYDRAADLYGQILNESPDDPDAAVAYARSLRYAGRLDLAQEVVRLALERIGPTRALRLEEAKAMLAAGRVAAVRPLAQALAEEAPDDWEAQSLLGLALDAAGEGETALAAHRRAHALAPTRAQAINNLALAEAAAGNLDKAIGLLQGPAGDPRAPLHMRMNLALLYMIADKPAKSEALVRANLPDKAVAPALETLAQFRGRPDRARAAGRLGPGVDVDVDRDGDVGDTR